MIACRPSSTPPTMPGSNSSRSSDTRWVGWRSPNPRGGIRSGWRVSLRRRAGACAGCERVHRLVGHRHECPRGTPPAVFGSYGDGVETARARGDHQRRRSSRVNGGGGLLLRRCRTSQPMARLMIMNRVLSRLGPRWLTVAMPGIAVLGVLTAWSGSNQNTAPQRGDITTAPAVAMKDGVTAPAPEFRP